MRSSSWSWCAVGGVAAISWACSDAPSGGAPPSDDGGADSAAAALQAVTPAQIFRGRSGTITITGVGTSFTDSSSVRVGSGKAIVDGVHAVSALGLTAHVTVPADDDEKTVDVTVDGLTAAGALAFADPLELQTAGVHVSDGEGASLVLVNHDAANPLDGAAISADLGSDVTVGVTNVSATRATLSAYAHPLAAAGSRDLTIRLSPQGSGDGGATDGGAGLVSVLRGAVTVDSVTWPTLTLGTPADVLVPAGKDGIYARLPGASGQLVDIGVTPAADAGTFQPFLALLDPAKGLTQAVSSLTGAELAAVDDVTGDALVYFAPLGVAGSDVHATLLAQRTNAVFVNEVEPNNITPNAQQVTAPVVVSAQLTSTSDKDVYALTVTQGTLVVRTLPVAGGSPLDTTLAIYDSNFQSMGKNDDEDPVMSDPMSLVVTQAQAGLAYVHVEYSPKQQTPVGPYRIAMFVR